MNDNPTMFGDNCWGLKPDHELWSGMLAAGDESLGHNLWCAVIREIAGRTISNHAEGQYLLSDEDEEPEEDEEDQRECLISRWLDDSLPIYAFLVDVLGEYDYFRDIGLSWDESISLTGNACPFTQQVVGDLKYRLSFNCDAEDAVTEDAVEDFYAEWRTRFLGRVYKAAQEVNQR